MANVAVAKVSQMTDGSQVTETWWGQVTYDSSRWGEWKVSRRWILVTSLPHQHRPMLQVALLENPVCLVLSTLPPPPPSSTHPPFTSRCRSPVTMEPFSVTPIHSPFQYDKHCIAISLCSIRTTIMIMMKKTGDMIIKSVWLDTFISIITTIMISG